MEGVRNVSETATAKSDRDDTVGLGSELFQHMRVF